MAKPEKIEIRSEEVQEILGTPPSWLVSWGTTLALFTIVLLGWAGYFLPYPETVGDRIKVYTTDPPKKLMSPSSSEISNILVEHEDTVVSGQTILVFESRAKFEDVLTLEDYIVMMKGLSDSALLSFQPPTDLLLGSLQEDLYTFLEKQESFRLKMSNAYEDYSLSQLNRRIRNARSVVAYEKEQKKTLEKQLKLVEQRYIREENLHQGNLFSVDELRKTKEEVVSLQRRIQTINSTIKSKQFEIDMAQSEKSGVQGGSEYSKTAAATDLRESFLQLQDQLEGWKRQHLVVAPVDGIVLFEKEKVSEKQHVNENIEIGVVVPLEKKETIGRMYLSSKGTGKIKEGQDVVVKFDSYPFEEFGAVKGVVYSKGKYLQKEDKIPIEITFPKGLTTNSGFSIKPDQELTGDAEILLDTKRFIEKVFEKLKTVNG